MVASMNNANFSLHCQSEVSDAEGCLRYTGTFTRIIRPSSLTAAAREVSQVV
ncbi:MAG: hypothetical protein LBJ67_16115 [Planctomycetaceae bacterium]|jgi:hypothetical protein|nr:hypothetical protein [Planctomycetaceae bacterium]